MRIKTISRFERWAKRVTVNTTSGLPTRNVKPPFCNIVVYLQRLLWCSRCFWPFLVGWFRHTRFNVFIKSTSPEAFFNGFVFSWRHGRVTELPRPNGVVARIIRFHLLSGCFPRKTNQRLCLLKKVQLDVGFFASSSIIHEASDTSHDQSPRK